MMSVRISLFFRSCKLLIYSSSATTLTAGRKRASWVNTSRRTREIVTSFDNSALIFLASYAFVAVAVPLIVAAATALHLLCIVQSFLFINRRWPEVSIIFLTSSISIFRARNSNNPIIHLLNRLKFLSEAAIEILTNWFSHGFSCFCYRVFEKYARAEIPTKADASLCSLLLIERQRWVWK